MNKDAIVDSIMPEKTGDQIYVPSSNHTVALAKLTRAYAEMYDKIDRLRSDARRKRDEADRQELLIQDLVKQIAAIAKSLSAHVLPSE